MLPTWQAVADVLQEASVVMWKKLDQLEDDEGFLPWAKVIVRFKALQARRTVARDRLVLSEETVALLSEETLALASDQIARERNALDTCLQKLSNEHRELVLLPYGEPGGLTELDERTNRSPNSLYKLLGRLPGKASHLCGAGTGCRRRPPMNNDQSGELIQRYFLGTISEDEMAELDRRLKDDEGLRGQFVAAARPGAKAN